MTWLWFVAHVALVFVLPILFVGIINRTKALWAGRRGPPLLQSAYDLARLLRKRPVYSEVATDIFWIGPLALLGTTLVTALLVPVLGSHAPLSLSFDFVALAYLWALGRFLLVLSALSTGSSFEGMGAAREATFSALLEPAFLVTLGSLSLATGARSFAAILVVAPTHPASIIVIAGASVALFVVLVTEASRMPVDDPTTHLELTMVHEVMVLDHGGPELAAIQFASALKMTLCAAMLTTLLNPLHAPGFARAALSLVGILGIAIVIGCLESLVARIKLRAVPEFLLGALAAGLLALLAAAWSLGGTP